MVTRNIRSAVILGVLAGCLFAGCRRAEPPAPAPEEFVIGILLVGPYNDRGWSQATYEGCLYVEGKVPGTKVVYVDKVNPADRPGTTPAQLAESLVAKGARLVIFNSDDMKDGALDFAKANPSIPVIHASGDSAWKEGRDYKGLPNVCNIMGRMEYGEAIAGCAAALATKTGKIGYLGPLINDETRRLAVATYLGARYAWVHYRGRQPEELDFKVTWIGFWFNIPGVTADPTQVADEFFNSGYDVVVSGIDTTEALVEARKFAEAGKPVWAVQYDFEGGCAEAPAVCLGVPYFNWGPAFLAKVEEIRAGRWTPSFDWLGPDWKDIENRDTSSVGFRKGDALTPENAAKVDEFIAALASGLNLWVGPMNLQDGTPYLKDGEPATDQQIWYFPQLVQGMQGQSVPSK